MCQWSEKHEPKWKCRHILHTQPYTPLCIDIEGQPLILFYCLQWMKKCSRTQVPVPCPHCIITVSFTLAMMGIARGLKLPKAPQIAVWVRFSSADVMLESLLLWMLMLTLLETDVFFLGSHIIDSNLFHKCRKGRCHDLSYDTVTCLSQFT